MTKIKKNLPQIKIGLSFVTDLYGLFPQELREFPCLVDLIQADNKIVILFSKDIQTYTETPNFVRFPLTFNAQAKEYVLLELLVDESLALTNSRLIHLENVFYTIHNVQIVGNDFLLIGGRSYFYEELPQEEFEQQIASNSLLEQSEKTCAQQQRFNRNIDPPAKDSNWGEQKDPRLEGYPESNGFLFSQNGKLKCSFCLGDGIQNVFVRKLKTSKDKKNFSGKEHSFEIICTYFDEGVFGNNNWDYTLGAGGITAFNERGQVIFTNNELPIYDCYLAFLDEEQSFYFYYYSDFDLVKLNQSSLAIQQSQFDLKNQAHIEDNLQDLATKESFNEEDTLKHVSQALIKHTAYAKQPLTDCSYAHTAFDFAGVAIMAKMPKVLTEPYFKEQDIILHDGGYDQHSSYFLSRVLLQDIKENADNKAKKQKSITLAKITNFTDEQGDNLKKICFIDSRNSQVVMIDDRLRLFVLDWNKIDLAKLS